MLIKERLVGPIAKSSRMAQMGLEDPLGYVDGPNIYQFELSDPVSLLDPTGTAAVALPNPGGNWGPINPTTGQPTYLPPIDGGWKPVANPKYNPSNPYSRPGKWVPVKPQKVPGGKGGQPQGSWDPVPSKKYPNGHGDLDDGKGVGSHVDENGKPISATDAHDYRECDIKNPVSLLDDDGMIYETIPQSVYDARYALAQQAAAAAAKAAWDALPWYSKVWNWRSSPSAGPSTPPVGIPGVNPLLGGSNGVAVPETGPIGIPVFE
jgi:hypothetical protein